MIGDIVQKYESGKLGPRSISNGVGDPGGVSYGTYQLASRTGTLVAFLNKTGYTSNFKGLLPGTKPFNDKWLEMCNNPNFVIAQHDFIMATHYTPLRKHADGLELPSEPAVNEALWSMSIQHGKAAVIVDAAHDMLKDVYTTKECIQCLYQARCNYVDKLGMPNLKVRYASELKDVLGML